VSGVLAGSGDGSVAGLVRSGLHEDGSGRALDEGTVVACGGNFDLIGMLQHAAAVASSLVCGASLRGICGLRGGGVARLGPVRVTTLEVVCSATRVGSVFFGGWASLPMPDDCGHGGGRLGGCQWRSWGGAVGAWQDVVDASGWRSRQLVRAASRGLVVVV
jgi:hypothetical protein